eukprot:4193549-Prymnesium_polylepis.1
MRRCGCPFGVDRAVTGLMCDDSSLVLGRRGTGAESDGDALATHESPPPALTPDRAAGQAEASASGERCRGAWQKAFAPAPRLSHAMQCQ